jgi:UDP:flavonoid glycosyltransferase YjiC (YdhE family)
MSSHADHHRIAAAIRAAGAGDSIDANASEEEWREAISAVLADVGARERARELGELVRSSRGAQVAADELEALVGSRQQLHEDG